MCPPGRLVSLGFVSSMREFYHFAYNLYAMLDPEDLQRCPNTLNQVIAPLHGPVETMLS